MITLIHPSRGRPLMALQAFDEWTRKAFSKDSIEYILSIDTSDRDQNHYFDNSENTGVNVIINANRSIVDAVNRAAEIAKGDIMVVVSDDFGCPDAWDTILVNHFKDVESPMILHVNDGIQDRVCTLPIINRAYYQLFGYIYHPHYFSMFADDDLTECAKKIGAYKADFSLLFQHRHYINGMNKRDTTYDRENSKLAWEVGKRIFQRRKQLNFEL